MSLSLSLNFCINIFIWYNVLYNLSFEYPKFDMRNGVFNEYLWDVAYPVHVYVLLMSLLRINFFLSQQAKYQSGL